MTITMDASGRLVIPKEIREAARLEPGTPLDITFCDGKVQIEPAPRAVKLVRRGRFMVAVPTEPSQPLTGEAVRAVRQQLRDRHR